MTGPKPGSSMPITQMAMPARAGLCAIDLMPGYLPKRGQRDSSRRSPRSSSVACRHAIGFLPLPIDRGASKRYN